jgi:tetratricopeptide (TPR) repeat protein
MAITNMNLGSVCQFTGNWEQAMDLYKKALFEFEKVGDERRVALTKGNIAILYNLQGKKEKAKRLFQDVLQIFERIGDRPNAEIIRSHLEELKTKRSTEGID